MVKEQRMLFAPPFYHKTLAMTIAPKKLQKLSSGASLWKYLL